MAPQKSQKSEIFDQKWYDYFKIHFVYCSHKYFQQRFQQHIEPTVCLWHWLVQDKVLSKSQSFLQHDELFRRTAMLKKV